MPQGRKSHVGMGKETTFGTAVAATVYHRFRTSSLDTAIEEVTPPNIQGVFDQGPTYQGLKTHEGEVEFDAHPTILGHYLVDGIGADTLTVLEAGVRLQHDFDVRQVEFSATSVMQPYTFEMHKDLGNAFQYAGGNVSRLRFNFGIGAKVLGATAGVLFKTMARIAATSPTFEATQAFRWNQAVITLPDPTSFAVIQDLTIEIVNGLQGMAFIDGTQEVARIRAEGPREVMVSGTMLATDAEATEFINGTERYLKVVFTGPTLGAGNYKLEFWFPKFRYTAYPIPIRGAGETMVAFSGKAKYDPATVQTPLRVRLVNGVVSAY